MKKSNQKRMTVVALKRKVAGLKAANTKYKKTIRALRG